MKAKIAVVGDLVYDVLMWRCSRAYGALVCRESYSDVGGSSNILITASRAGAEAHAIGCVGLDELGSLYKKALESEGVSTRNIVLRGATSIVTAFEVEGSIEYRAFINEMLSSELVDVDWGSYDVVVMNGNTLSDPKSIGLFESILERASKESIIVLTTGVAGASEIPRMLNKLVEEGSAERVVLVANEKEAMEAAGVESPVEAARRLSRLSHTAIVTMGPRGCIVSINRETIVVEGVEVKTEPHKEIGAGDVFAAVLSVLIGRYGLEDVVEYTRISCRAAEEKVRRGLIGRRVLSRECISRILSQKPSV